MNGVLSMSSITVTPAARTLASDSASRAAQSSRLTGIESFAACRTSACSSGESLSQLTFDITSTSGTIRCSFSV